VLNTQDGVWHETGTLQNGNFVLAGHRFKYLPPNTSTLYNLKELTVGDTIIVDWYKTRYIYVVDKTETVRSTDTAVLNQTGGPRLTIYTCANAAQTWRTVVLAHMVP
jgi:LPXTG-site transpeptidase (sortase) family protein